MPQGTVEVELVRGHDLKDVEVFGKSDPYAVLSCGHVSHRSHIIYDAGSNPVWNQTFQFEVPDGVTNLGIAIYDHEGHGRDEAMGTALIPLADVYAHREIAPAKYKVLLRNGRSHGEVELGLKFFPKVYHGSLELLLVQGHNLLSADVLDAGSDPVWNQTFAFTVDSEVSEAIIKLFDRDTFTADDPLGDAKIPLQTVFIEGHVPPTTYKVFSSEGKQQGEVRVALKFIPKA